MKKVQNQVGSELIASIEDLVTDLFYTSETDAEISAFFMTGNRHESLADQLQEHIAIKDGIFELSSFDDFFRRLTTVQDWHDAAERDRTQTFHELEKLLETNLEDRIVCKTGRIKRDVYVVGFDAEGQIAGIRTKAVET